jgi:hypothetical protein
MAYRKILKAAKGRIKKRIGAKVKSRLRKGFTSSARRSLGGKPSIGKRKPIRVRLPGGIKISTSPRRPAPKHPSYTQLAAQRKGEANQRRIAAAKRRSNLAPRRTRR